jgi:hypothetical protein
MKGALIYAFDNGLTDYVSMAAWSAANIRRHLKIPVAVITDDLTAQGFDQVIYQPAPTSDSRHFVDYNKSAEWHNQSRADAYELSPWDDTLLLDADYVVASDQLQVLLSIDQDFLAHRWAYDLTGIDDFAALNYFGQHRQPMWWATVMRFRRSRAAELIFGTMTMVRDNWAHYCNLYGVRERAYRNDFALSIAVAVVNGQVMPAAHTIPWQLASVLPTAQLTQTAADNYTVQFANESAQQRRITVNNMDFHAMGKQQLEKIVANPC